MPVFPLLRPFLAEPHWTRWLMADGLHCNSEGHGFLFDQVLRWPALMAWAGLQLQELATPVGW